MAGEKFSSALGIDTSKKPMPAFDMVLAVDSHSGEPSDPDVNWVDGGALLSKTGEGQAIFVTGNQSHHISTQLAGYGTTASGLSWVYELVGLKHLGKKVYLAVSSQYAGKESRRIFMSLGVDNPTDVASFKPAAYAVAGKKEP